MASYHNKDGKVNSAHHSSEKMDWETPNDFFQALHKEFNFTLDVCATDENAKCPRYLTPELNALSKKWTNEICWMNPPPYGKEIGTWLRKARKESYLRGATVVCFVPARTETKVFQDVVFGLDINRDFQASEVRTIQGRVVFVGAKSNAPFSSVLIIFTPGNQTPPALLPSIPKEMFS